MRKNGCFLMFCKKNVDKNARRLYHTNINDNEYQYRKIIYISKLRRIK